MLWKYCYFVVTTRLKNLTSYLDNGYDDTKYFCRFEKFLCNTLFLPSFIAVRSQIAELDWGRAFYPPPYPTQPKEGYVRP